MAAELLSEVMASATSAMIGNQSQNGDGQEAKQKQLGGYSAAMSPFPSTFSSDPTKSLSPLRDNHSDFHSVSKTCLLLNQFAANGSSKSTTTPSTSCGSVDYVESSSLFHESSFAQILSESIAALSECIREHHDRRCRILACKTVAVVARAAAARLRKSPHTATGARDETAAGNFHGGGSSSNLSGTAGSNYVNRLDDEIGTDVPMALCTAALEDSDEGVAATAMSSLGTMILSTIPTPGTLNDDELWTEVRAMAQIGQQPYAPSLRQLLDEDATTQQSELQVRVLENVLCPRLVQLASRFLVLSHPSHVAMVLPVLTASLVYLSKTTVPVTNIVANSNNNNGNGNGASDGTKAKRRTGDQSDCNALIEMVVEGMLLPWMQESTVLAMGAATTAALSSIRLIHACPVAAWVREVAHWAIVVLKEECGNHSLCLEAQLPILAALVILSRVVPLPERVDAVLEFVVDCVLELPSTTMTPSGIVSAGLLLELDKPSTGPGMDQYRKPTRPAFWAELALGFFLDGPVESKRDFTTETGARSRALARFLRSSKLRDILEDRTDDDTAIGTHGKIREEMVTAFCMVAFRVGRRHRRASETGRGTSAPMARRDELEEWVRLSLTVLNVFSDCILWGAASLYMDEEITMLAASQVAYARLLQEVLHAAGMLNANSISLKMTPIASPPHLLWDSMEEDSEYLVLLDRVPLTRTTTDAIGTFMDDLVKKEMKGAGVVSHHMRIFLMSLAADHWIQTRHYATKAIASPSVDIGMGMGIDSAKQLLVTVSPRRMFGKVVESNKSHIENYSAAKKESYQKFAQDTVGVCVACIESMALMACHYTKKFGISNDTKAVLNYSVKSLQGKAGNDSDAPILPVCQAAIERIESAFQSSDKIMAESISLSPLVPDTIQRRSVISHSRITQGRDAFNEGYITQLSRQIISARADRCIYSFPSIQNPSSAVRKQNWLRLSLPPLPQSRNPRSFITRIPRFQWGSNVTVCTAGSDPAAVTIGYFLRRNMRYDGEDDFCLMIAMRVDNLTAVEIPNGLRLELGVTEENISNSADAQDVISLDISKSLKEGHDNVVGEDTLGVSAVTYERGLKGGDHLSWNITMNPLPMTGSMTLNPSVVFRSLEKEAPHATWVTTDAQKKDGEETSVTSGSSKATSVGDTFHPNGEQRQNVSIACEPIKLSPMIGLQPCPLVFYRDGLGDVESFQFLWSRMPCQLAPLKLVADPSSSNVPERFYDELRVAAISGLKFEGEGTITHFWAFVNPRGKRAMFVLSEEDDVQTLHARGDDRQLLLCLLGTSSSRNALISALKPGLRSLHEKVSDK